MKKILSIILILILIAFSGCNILIPTPIELATKEPDQYIASSNQILILSYPNSDLAKLTRITLEKINYSEASIVYSTIESLLSGINSADCYVPFNEQATLTSVEISRNLAIVNITGDFDNLSQKQLFSSIISLTNTVTEINDIDYVKLSINGADIVPSGILANPIPHQSENLYLLFLEHQDFLNSQTGIKLSVLSNHILYFTDLSSSYLLCEVRKNYQTGENLVVSLFNELKAGPRSADEMKSAIPKNVVLQSIPEIYENETLGNILTLSLDAPKHETIDNESRYMMAASLVKTIQNAIPEIDGVRILINSQPALSSSIMYSEDFSDILANIVTLYFPNNDSTCLLPVKRALSQKACLQPIERMKQLIRGVLDNDKGSVINTFTDTITEDDILSFNMSANTAYINFSQNLYEECKYEGIQESLFIYSIVNTLTEFDNIKRVQFLIEGEKVKSLCGHIVITYPLLPNPGIVRK